MCRVSNSKLTVTSPPPSSTTCLKCRWWNIVVISVAVATLSIVSQFKVECTNRMNVNSTDTDQDLQACMEATLDAHYMKHPDKFLQAVHKSINGILLFFKPHQPNHYFLYLTTARNYWKTWLSCWDAPSNQWRWIHIRATSNSSWAGDGSWRRSQDTGSHTTWNHVWLYLQLTFSSF